MWYDKEYTISLKKMVLFLVFLATLNTLNAHYFFVFAAFGILLFCPNGKIVKNTSLVVLFVLAISLSVFSSRYSYSITGVLKTFTYLLCYIIGYGLYEYKAFNSNESLKNFYIVCIFVIAGSFLHYLINWFTNITSVSRNTVDFWTKTVISATGQAPMACLASAFSLACLFSDTSKKVKGISIIIILLTLGYNLILSGRTLFVLLLIVLVVAFIHNLKNQRGKKLKTIFIALLLVVVILMIFNLNMFGIRTKIEATPFYERFFTEESTMELDEDSRMDHKIDFIKNASKYLWGGANMRSQFGWAHDIILDTYDEAGIFALVAILIYLLATIRRMVRCVSNKQFPFEFRQVVLCMYVILYVQFMVEPIIQGVPWLLSSFCIIDGSITRILNDYNK